MPDAQKFANKLRGSRVLIVGGSAGIGYAVAEGVIEEGAILHIASSSPDRVAGAVKSLQASYPSAVSRIHGHVCSLSDASTVEPNIIELFKATGTLDHVITTAGDAFQHNVTAEGKSGVHAATVENLVQGSMVRYLAAQILAKHAAKNLEPTSKSSFTLTSGAGAEKPRPGGSTVAAFGMGLMGLARGLAVDLAPIRANAVSPGGVNTELLAKLGPDIIDKIKQNTCTGKIAEPEEVAEAYLYLLKDTNSTGNIIRTDGGFLVK